MATVTPLTPQGLTGKPQVNHDYIAITSMSNSNQAASIIDLMNDSDDAEITKTFIDLSNLAETSDTNSFFREGIVYVKA